MLKVELFNEVKEISAFLQHKGWAERNAGNLSFRMDDSILITETGAKFRDVAKNVERYIVEMSTFDAKHFDREKSTLQPSSELPSHLMIHEYLAVQFPEQKAILHTHPTHLIAFTHKFYDETDDQLYDRLACTMPEVRLYIPRGIGFVESAPPGSHKLAFATLEKFVNHDIVIWKAHGVIGVAPTLWEIVDMIDIIDKAAYISLLSQNATSL
jgi:rhamnulose-1-phosphate aldolase